MSLRLLPTSEEVKSKILPYGLAILSIGILLLKGGTGPVSVVESTKYIKQVEVKEVIKYVEVARKDDRRVEITKPDGTHIVSTHVSTTDRREQVQIKEEGTTETQEEVRKSYASLHRYNLGLTYDVTGNVGVSAGIRLGDLPIFLQVYTVPTKLYGAIGFQLEL
jgi:hypothetical protein